MKYSLNKRLITTFIIKSLKNLFIFVDYIARIIGYGIIYILIARSMNGDIQLNYYNQDGKVQIHFTSSNVAIIGGEFEKGRKETNGTKD